MGCAFVNQKESINSKDVELNHEITTPYFKETNDTLNIKHAISNDILKLKKPNTKKSKKNKINEKDNENDFININNQNKSYCSGPIITMLKRQVDNYKKTEKSLNKNLKKN